MANHIPLRTPKYRRERRPNSVDDAFVVLGGRQHYLGQFGSLESKEAFRRVIAEWALDGSGHSAEGNGITDSQLIARFWRHAKSYYRKPDGKTTTTLYNYKTALRPLRQMYGSTTVADFNPKALKAVRQKLVSAGLSRGVINKSVNMYIFTEFWTILMIGRNGRDWVKSCPSCLDLGPAQQGDDRCTDRFRMELA